MLKIKRHEMPEDRSINMTPMIDVVFQLILFFMLTSSMTKATQIQVDLPQSSTGARTDDRKTLIVTYRIKQGVPEVTLNGQPVANLDALGAAMRRLASGPDNPRVDVQIDKTVPYQNVVSVLDSVRNAGFPRFSLLTMASSRHGNP